MARKRANGKRRVGSLLPAENAGESGLEPFLKRDEHSLTSQ
jgi:hypothetical protein